jgi:hypothetical protein
MHERVRRASTAARIKPKERAGRSRDFSAKRGDSPQDLNPPAENHCRWTAKKRMSRIPAQNWGMAKPI